MFDEYQNYFVAGRDAFHAGVELRDCPHDSRLTPDQHRAWCAGFVEAEISQYIAG